MRTPRRQARQRQRRGRESLPPATSSSAVTPRAEARPHATARTARLPPTSRRDNSCAPVLTGVTAGNGLATEPTCAARAILVAPPPRAPPRASAPRRRQEPEVPAGGRHHAPPAVQLPPPGGVPDRARPPVPHLPHAHPDLQLRLHRRARIFNVLVPHLPHAQDQFRQLRQGGDDSRRAGGPPRRRHLQRGRRHVAAPAEGRQPRVLHPVAARLQQRRVPRHRRGARGDRGRRGAGRRGDLQGGHRGPADAVDAGLHLQGRVRRQPGLAVRVQQGGRGVRQGVRRRQRAGAVPLLRRVLESQEAPQHLVGGGHEALGPHHQRLRVRRDRQEDRADGQKPSRIRQERGHPVEVPARAGARSRLLRQQIPAGYHPQLRHRRPRHHGGDYGLVPLRALQEPAHPRKDRAGGLLLTEDAISRMQYLHAALTETLRLYPAVPIYCFSDDTLPDGYAVRKGDMVNYQPYPMGRMKFLWGVDAEEFRPERWLDDGGVFVPESPFKFTAFQAGPRICLGKEFAYRQMKIFAAVLLYLFRFQMWEANATVGYRPMLTLKMDGPLYVRAVPRR